MSDKPINLEKRRKLLQKMNSLEKQFRELRSEFITGETLTKMAAAQMQENARLFRPLAEKFHTSEIWLLEMLTLQGVVLKLAGHTADPADCLAVFTKNSEYAKDTFAIAVTKRIAQLEDEASSS